jgi:hypothetical protein
MPVARSGAADLISFLLLLQLWRSEPKRLGRAAISFNKAAVSVFLMWWICGGKLPLSAGPGGGGRGEG